MKKQPKALQSYRQIDRVTVGAIAIVAFWLCMVLHEAIGHGGAAILFGGHIRKVTNWYCSFGGIESELQGRAIALAGITLNLMVGLAVIIGGRLVPRSQEPTHYFLWFFAHLNLFAAGSYMLIFSFLSFGDLNGALADIPYSILARTGTTIMGAALLLWSVKHCNSTATQFTGDEVGWQRRHKTLTVVPYLVGSTVNVFAALLGSGGSIPFAAILISAAGSSFGAGAMFFCGEPIPENLESATVLTPFRSVPWILLGSVTLLLYYFLGRGVTFSVGSI